MPLDNPAARAGKDLTIGGLIVSGAETVYINNLHAAAVFGITSQGDVIITSPVNVYAGKGKIAVIGSITSKGKPVVSGSPTVFAGANGPGAPVEIS